MGSIGVHALVELAQHSLVIQITSSILLFLVRMHWDRNMSGTGMM